MRLVQTALAPTGLPCFASAWLPTQAQSAPPAAYLVYTLSRREARHSDDAATAWSLYVYLEMYSAGDPTQARRAVDRAMYGAGFAMVEQREKYDATSEQYRVSWTWGVQLDSSEEAEI